MPVEVKNDVSPGHIDLELRPNSERLLDGHFGTRGLAELPDQKAHALIDQIDSRDDLVKGLRGHTALGLIDNAVQKNWDSPFVAGMQGFAIPIMGNSSRGFVRQIADQLGVEPPPVERQGRPQKILDGIVKAAKEQNHPAVAITHSLSNNDMLERVLPKLKKENLQLDVWVMFDASYLRKESFPLPPKKEFRLIPSNVRFVVNVYAQGGGFNGREVNAADFENPFSRDNPTGTRWLNLKVPGGHLGMATADNAVQVRQHIEAALRCLRLTDPSNQLGGEDTKTLAAAIPE